MTDGMCPFWLSKNEIIYYYWGYRLGLWKYNLITATKEQIAPNYFGSLREPFFSPDKKIIAHFYYDTDKDDGYYLVTILDIAQAKEWIIYAEEDIFHKDDKKYIKGINIFRYFNL